LQEPVGALIPSAVEFAIVQAIADHVGGGYDLTVDPISKYPFSLPIGTKVLSLGAVPRGLAEVAQYLVAKEVIALSDSLTGGSSGGGSSGPLISESVDNYSYTLADTSSSGGTSKGALGLITGSVRHDLLLREFVRPQVSISWW
jgi:hypothetical protein